MEVIDNVTCFCVHFKGDGDTEYEYSYDGGISYTNESVYPVYISESSAGSYRILVRQADDLHIVAVADVDLSVLDTDTKVSGRGVDYDLTDLRNRIAAYHYLSEVNYRAAIERKEEYGKALGKWRHERREDIIMYRLTRGSVGLLLVTGGLAGLLYIWCMWIRIYYVDIKGQRHFIGRIPLFKGEGVYELFIPERIIDRARTRQFLLMVPGRHPVNYANIHYLQFHDRKLLVPEVRLYIREYEN